MSNLGPGGDPGNRVPPWNTPSRPTPAIRLRRGPGRSDPYGADGTPPELQPEPQPDPEEGNDGFAVAALVFGVLGGLLAIVFGIVALLRIRRSGRPGKSLALAGLVLAGVWLVGIGVALALSGPDDAARDGSGAIVDSGDLSAFSFREGDCWNNPPLDEVVQEVAAVPCTQAHDAEVYAVFDVELAEYPGDAQIGSAAETGCIERFEAFAGVDYASSTLEVIYLNPTQESWDTLDDRSAVCSITDPAAQTTGSLRGAAR